jgi:hypothetical protein
VSIEQPVQQHCPRERRQIVPTRQRSTQSGRRRLAGDGPEQLAEATARCFSDPKYTRRVERRTAAIAEASPTSAIRGRARRLRVGALEQGFGSVPPYAFKSREVVVVRHDVCLLLKRKRRQMRVVDEVARYADTSQHLAK